MGKIKRNCDHCKQEYQADERNLKRGWGLTCSKSCAASMREKSKPDYNQERVKRNNVRRVLWNDRSKTPKRTIVVFGVAFDYEGNEG